MRKIVLSGTSGAGKSTLIKSYKDDFSIVKELKNNKNSICDFYYELSLKEDRYGTNLFITSLMTQRFLDDSIVTEDTIFDRWIIDYIVAAELRIKPYNEEFFNYVLKIFEDMMTKIKVLPQYIILKTSFPELKNRILKRGRVDERESISADEAWYKKYHKLYNDTLIKYLEKYNIEYIVIDSTKYSKEETKLAADDIIHANK